MSLIWIHVSLLTTPFLYHSLIVPFLCRKIGGKRIMKRTYNKPVLNSETFVPNTYVAVCPPVNGKTEYWLACDGGDDDRDHTADGCLRATAYKITVNENTGIIESIFEMPNNSGWWDDGGYARNITVNGSPASSTPLKDLNGEYNLRWETQVIAVTMVHTGKLKLSTAVNVNLS